MKPHEHLEKEMMEESLRKSLPGMLGAYPVIAELSRSYYEELIKRGFTEEQALFIVTTQGVRAAMND